MTTEEMMEFYKNAWDKERENSNRLCMLKDEAIDKMLCLQERLKEAERFVQHDAWWEQTCFNVYTDRHGVQHEYRTATDYCKKYGLEIKNWCD